jgi:hypothetical protein
MVQDKLKRQIYAMSQFVLQFSHHILSDFKSFKVVHKFKKKEFCLFKAEKINCS